MPLGRTSLTGQGAGGKTGSDGRPGTFTSRTHVININPRQPGALDVVGSSAGTATLTWGKSPDDADLTA